MLMAKCSGVLEPRSTLAVICTRCTFCTITDPTVSKVPFNLTQQLRFHVSITANRNRILPALMCVYLYVFERVCVLITARR